MQIYWFGLLALIPLATLFRKPNHDIKKYLAESFGDIHWVNEEYQERELKLLTNYQAIALKKAFKDTFINNTNFTIDLFVFFVKSLKYSLNYLTFSEHRVSYRLKDTNQGFYFEYLNNNSVYLKNLFNAGWFYIWKGVRLWIVGLVIGGSIFYYLSAIRLLPINKVIFEWICILMFLYWLISGFVFFIKRYQFGKYTSVIQRFWRRSYILFWILEACLFLVFFYLTVNASAESFYMYDQTQVYKTHLYSWRFFLLKLLPITFLIVVGYIYLLSLRSIVFSKNVLFLFIMTGVLTYVIWLEFYQFYHILHFYGNLVWVYDIDEHAWNLEVEPRRTRIVNHYTSILMILKFWHIVFIYAFWVFFLLRVNELNRVRYPLLSANLQNFIILYIFAWVSMYPWIKFYFRKFLDNPYYWFYLNNHQIGFRILWNDLKLIFYSFTNFDFFSYHLKTNTLFRNFSFFYWQTFNTEFHFDGYKKHFIRDQIVSVLTQ